MPISLAMKCLLFLIILTTFSCTRFAERSPADKKVERHIVFDIDWTIANEIKKPTLRDLNNPRVIEVEGIYYFISDGLEEFIEVILSHKEMKISFYSGGSESRNLKLLAKIKLKSGKSLYDMAFKVLSKKDMVEIPNVPENAKFSERFKKDLIRVSENLDELVMFDDVVNFVVDNNTNQNEHVFFIGKAYEYFENFNDTMAKHGEYVPRSFEQWSLQRSRLIVLNGVFREAYEKSLSTGMPLSEVMKKYEEVLNLKGQEWNIHSKRLFKKIRSTPIANIRPITSDCHGLISTFLAH